MTLAHSTTIHFGEDALSHLEKILNAHHAKSCFIVTGKTAYATSGAQQKLAPFLRDSTITFFTDFSPNPTLEEIEKGIRAFRKNPIDVVIAIGGGSALDVAKSINLLSAQPGLVQDYIDGEKMFAHKGKPLIAIPTTAGTGSEVTRYAVFYINKTKHGLTHEFIRPDYALVDPTLTSSLPPAITAATGMDALGQAIESYWAVDSNELSKTYVREAIPLIIDHLKAAVTQNTPAARKAMSRGALLSGQAIDISRTTACHAISYPLTAYFGIPHGHGVGFTLAAMLKYNAQVTEEDCLDPRGSDYVHETLQEIVLLLGVATLEEATEKIQDLMRAIGLATRFRDMGLAESDLETIVTHGFHPDRVTNNPRRLTPDALRKMLKALY